MSPGPWLTPMSLRAVARKGSGDKCLAGMANCVVGIGLLEAASVRTDACGH